MEIYSIIYLFIYSFIYLPSRKGKKKFLVAGQPEEKNTGFIDYTHTAHLQKVENIEVNDKSSNTYSKILGFWLILSRRYCWYAG